MKHIWKIVILVIIVILGWYGIQQSKEEPTTLKLGALYAQTGPAAQFGELSIQGVRDAVAYFKEENPEVKVELILEDSAADPKLAVAAANKLLSIDKVDAVVVGMSGVSAAVAPLADTYKRLIISDAAAYGLTKDREYLAQNLMPSLGDIARHINGRDEWQRVAIVYVNDEFGNTWNRNITTGLKENKTASSYQFDAKASSFRTEALKIKQFNPDVVVVVGYGPALNQALTDLSIQKVTAVQLTYLSCTLPGVMTDGRYSLEGQYSYEYPALANTQLAKWIRERGVENPSTFYTLAFENTVLALTAVTENQDDVSQALNYLKSKSVTGLYGEIRFSNNGVVERDLALSKVVEGKCVPVR